MCSKCVQSDRSKMSFLGWISEANREREIAIRAYVLYFSASQRTDPHSSLLIGLSCFVFFPLWFVSLDRKKNSGSRVAERKKHGDSQAGGA